MGTATWAALMICAHTNLSASMEAERPIPLHEHPTLVNMLERNNELRASVGLPPHRISPELTRAAQDHARYMARTGSFSHYSNGGPQGRAAKYGFSAPVRENIAMGYRSVNNVFSGWRSSGGHWASIVSSTSEAGFGYAISESGTPYWVGVYGNGPRRSPPAASETEAESGSMNGSEAESGLRPRP